MDVRDFTLMNFNQSVNKARIQSESKQSRISFRE